MLRIYASEVAACIGQNRYCSRGEMAEKVWKRSDPDGYAKALLRNNASEKPDIALEIDQLKLWEKVRSVVDAETVEYAKKMEGVVINLDETVSPEIVSGIRSFINTERGKNAEDSMLKKLEATLGKKITQRNDKFYKIHIDIPDDEAEVHNTGKNSGKRFLLGGKVDGITEDNILVEVKNRQNRLFQHLPVYEKVQVHVYMFLTGISECYLVQYYGDDEQMTLVDFSEQFFLNMKQELIDFAKRVYGIMISEKEQDVFLADKDSYTLFRKKCNQK